MDTYSIICAIIVTLINANIAQSQSNSALIYLAKFGYIDPKVTNPESQALMDNTYFSNAIKEFQAFANLTQTGELDEETIEMMKKPRCGVKDKVGLGSIARKKRYALQGSRWRVRDLTYRISKYPTKLTKKQVDTDVAKAFKVWEEVTDLTFAEAKTGKGHIEIRFETGEHGDGDPFDGIGGTLAHAYFPIYGGDAHFDNSERWTVNKYSGTNLFIVAAHEFGHSLGLSHSDVASSLMAPFYQGYTRNFKLDIDDITAIQSLYGEKTVRANTPETPKPDTRVKPAEHSALCDGKIDAIVTMADKETYVFKGSMYWMLTDDGTAEGYPKEIGSLFKGLPNDLDAAFTFSSGKTYFFKGDNYWRTSSYVIDDGYPKKIKAGFAGIPSNVDTAFLWSGNGKIYFFKGTNYWKFDPEKMPPVSDRYPKDISIWEGLPYYMDGALKYKNDFTYFFKGKNYWRFNDRSFAIDDADPAFPRDAGTWWFGCPSNENQVLKTTETPSYDHNYDYSYDDYNDNSIDLRNQGYQKSSARYTTTSITVLVPFILAVLL